MAAICVQLHDCQQNSSGSITVMKMNAIKKSPKQSHKEIARRRMIAKRDGEHNSIYHDGGHSLSMKNVGFPPSYKRRAWRGVALEKLWDVW